MKDFIPLACALLALGLPLAAEARCDRYQNDTFTLNLPATISVPDNLPIGSVITRQAFSGSAPAYFAYCRVAERSWILGRYQKLQDPSTGTYHTEVPGIGVRISMTWAGGRLSNFALYDQGPEYVHGRIPSFTSAEATFYKIGPVTNSTLPSGRFWEKKWATVPDRVLLQLGNSVSFIRAPATCDLEAGDVNRTITLPEVRVRDFDSAISAGAHDFELTANCSDASDVTLRFTGTPAPDNPTLFANTGSAGGVALRLYSRLSGTPQTISANDTRTVIVTGNRAVLPLGAAYHKSGPVSQGTLASTATVTITYN
ncbi:fimbrial protein [Pseudomonas sp. Marseille-Q1929]|uniref:fimbrial protein n=1 Tax=Pseudomonas sp. Marseille-Q1929 TaxID=2730402 RepID=UPI001A9007CD|nr:fimbrial protein [Pseudomonas sp. Marseille-Q1929]MBO0493287.1 type 1 fimbrial protein [Pseudomonas sp. Marseille-Q1929]